MSFRVPVGLLLKMLEENGNLSTVLLLKLSTLKTSQALFPVLIRGHDEMFGESKKVNVTRFLSEQQRKKSD